MKKILLFICFIFGFTSATLAAEEPTFIMQVDTLWKAKNHGQILQLAAAEAAKQPAPPEAFVVLFGYYLFIAGDHGQAVLSLDSLVASLENTNPGGHQAALTFKNDFSQIPGDQTQPPGPEELDALHQMFPDEFPVKSLLLSISPPDRP